MGMFTYMMAVRGANWVKDFKRTPEQQAQQLAQMQAASQAAAPPAAGQQTPQAQVGAAP